MKAVPDSTATTDPKALFDIAGRSALIVGATGALGQMASRSLAAAGARLTLAAGGAEQLDRIAEEASRAGAEVETVNRRHDSEVDAEAMVEAAVARHGSLDIVVVASGMNRIAPTTEYNVDDWDTVMQANLRGPWLVCRSAGRRLIAQGRGGKVVLVSSPRGVLGHPGGYSAYSPSKAGINLLTKTLATEWGPHGINVNAVAPTVFRSPVTAWMYADDERGTKARQAFLARIPLGRLAEPEDFAGPLLFLVSAASDFCTGHVLYVDGGYMAG
jgi:NAD(P)-dependent dehydrogenase (short-subunit alcohol dehydrogenase family)